LLKRLIVGFEIVISMIVVTVGYCAQMIIEILIMDMSPSSPGAGRKRRKRRSAASSCHDVK